MDRLRVWKAVEAEQHAMLVSGSGIQCEAQENDEVKR